MRLHRVCLMLFGLFSLSLASASGASIDFNTQSTAVQTITSDLVGGSIVLSAAGTQHFTVDLDAGTANVTSDFKGTDLVTPVGTFDYDLYNTATTGTAVDNGDGTYTIRYTLLFELKVTSGALDGVVFETRTDSLFETTVTSIPFPDGTVLGDPARPDDETTIYLQADPNGVLASLGVNVGDPVGTSSNRTVTILTVVPEPSGLALLGLGALALAGVARRSRS
jgi:hypothetical protein